MGCCKNATAVTARGFAARSKLASLAQGTCNLLQT